MMKTDANEIHIRKWIMIISLIGGIIGMVEFGAFWILMPRAIFSGDLLLIAIDVIGLVGVYCGARICGEIFTGNLSIVGKDTL